MMNIKNMITLSSLFCKNSQRDQINSDYCCIFDYNFPELILNPLFSSSEKIEHYYNNCKV